MQLLLFAKIPSLNFLGGSIFSKLSHCNIVAYFALWLIDYDLRCFAYQTGYYKCIVYNNFNVLKIQDACPNTKEHTISLTRVTQRTERTQQNAAEPPVVQWTVTDRA